MGGAKKQEEQLNKKATKTTTTTTNKSKDSSQIALRTECVSKNLCQTEDVAINHFSLGESAFTDLPFSTSDVLTGFTTVAKTSYMLNLTLYRNPAVAGCFYGFRKRQKFSQDLTCKQLKGV